MGGSIDRIVIHQSVLSEETLNIQTVGIAISLSPVYSKRLPVT
jgi:hypothetical protein